VDDFISCLAGRLNSMDVDKALGSCLGTLSDDLFFSITGRRGRGSLDEAAALALLEAFLGGVDLRLLTREAAEKLYSYLAARARRLEGRRGEAARLAVYLAGEVVDRLARGLARPEPPPPLLPVTPTGLAAIHGFLWPLHVDVEHSGVREEARRILDKASRGGAAIRGCPGCGRTAMLYLVAREAAERGMRIIYGAPQEWMGSHVLVVSPSPSPGAAAPTVWLEDGEERIFGDDYLAALAARILDFDGVDYSGDGVERLVEKSGGSPVYIEAASLLLRLRGGRADTATVEALPGDTGSLVAESAGLVELGGLPRLPVFPGDMAGSGVEELAGMHVVLGYEGEGLYAYRNSLWLRHAGRLPRAEEALASKTPWWAALAMALHLGAGGVLVEKAAGALLGGGVVVLDAVAAADPETLYDAFYPYTSFRSEIIAEKAVEYGGYSVAAVLYGLAADVLRGLPPEKYGERRAVLLLKRAEAEIERGLPEAAIPLLREARRLTGDNWVAAVSLVDEGVAHAVMGDEAAAAEALGKGVEMLGGKPDAVAAKAYAALGALAEGRGDIEEAVEMYRRALDVIAQLVYRGDCSLASELYRIGVKLRELRGRGDPRVCGGLAKCGRFELYTKYGC